MCQALTQYTWLTLQQRQDVLVEKERTKAEEVPQAEVCQRPGIPHARVSLDHRRLSNGDFKDVLVLHALAARQDHPLVTRPPERQKKLREHGFPLSAMAWHGAHSECGAPTLRALRAKSTHSSGCRERK